MRCSGAAMQDQKYKYQQPAALAMLQAVPNPAIDIFLISIHLKELHSTATLQSHPHAGHHCGMAAHCSQDQRPLRPRQSSRSSVFATASSLSTTAETAQIQAKRLALPFWPYARSCVYRSIIASLRLQW